MTGKIKWSYAGDPVPGLEECMALIKVGKKDDGFLLCERGDLLMQASGYGDGPYLFEIGFDSAAGTNWYSYPKDVSWDELVDLSRRFEGGEDFSYAKDQWVCDVDAEKDAKTGKRLFRWFFIFCFVAIVLSFFYSNVWSIFSWWFTR